MATEDSFPATLGEVIRRQRELAELPMRQLAAMAGISNPYLSQIERGLRAPSEQVLDAIAQSLQTTADALQGHTGSGAEHGEPAVLTALRDDQRLTAAQRQAIAELYQACVEATAARRRRRGGSQGQGTG